MNERIDIEMINGEDITINITEVFKNPTNKQRGLWDGWDYQQMMGGFLSYLYDRYDIDDDEDEYDTYKLEKMFEEIKTQMIKEIKTYYKENM